VRFGGCRQTPDHFTKLPDIDYGSAKALNKQKENSLHLQAKHGLRLSVSLTSLR